MVKRQNGSGVRSQGEFIERDGQPQVAVSSTASS
jgi:hypothetical protein